MLRILTALLACTGAARAVTITANLVGFSAAEERVLHASIDLWERTIADDFLFTVDIYKSSFSGSTLAFARDLVADAEGRPSSAVLEFNDLVGTSLGWFVDPTPWSPNEFTPTRRSYQYAPDYSHPASSLFDMFYVANHELGHALGFSAQFDRFASKVTGSGTGFRTYNGDGFSAFLTSPSDGTHVPHSVYFYDLMTQFVVPGDRRLPSPLDLRILSDAYGYRTLTPLYPTPEPSPAVLTALAAAAILITARRPGASGPAWRHSGSPAAIRR